jgi:hypothetical protein
VTPKRPECDPERVGLFSRKRREPQVHVGDPRFDGWETVDQYEDLSTATAFSGRLAELDIACALTADWPLDEFGRGTIYLQVPADRYDDATVALEGWDDV